MPLVLLCVLGLLVGCSESPPAPETAAAQSAPAAEPTADFVGAQACAGCHAETHAAWSASHHALAMQPANPATVLGDFEDAQFTYNGVTTRFRREGDAFYVDTDGPTGAIEPFEVTHTYGVYPLQQYLVALERGRLQALSIVWDSRAEGQRWYHLYPDESVDHTDILHWTRSSQSWNTMCADCHSTNVSKRYDPEVDAFATRYSEMNVGCEACHGPGSIHAAGPGADYGHEAAQMDTCAPCHSRRSQLAEGFRPGLPLLDFYQPSAIAEPLYHTDGQILDEVYVYGSFLQSKMHDRGVTCNHCHDPHAASLKIPGNGTCTQCHTEAGRDDFPTLAAGTYDDASHHFHEDIACIDCHMPSRTYMGVDERHDHGFRIPRPDLSERYGTPNPCTGCHTDQTARWATEQIASWYGPRDDMSTPSLAAVLAQGATQHFDAERPLSAAASDDTLSGLARRSVMNQLGGYEFGYSLDAITAGLRDPDANVRLGALQNLDRLPEARRFGHLKRLVADESRAVRIAAAPMAARFLNQALAAADMTAIRSAVAEFETVQQLHAERPESHTNLGNLRLAMGDIAAAEAGYKQALVVEPRWIPAMVNLADLYRGTGRDAQAKTILAEAVATQPPNADAAYAYGLWFVRNGDPGQGLEHLRRAAQLSDTVNNAYVLALALNGTGDAEAAVSELRRAIAAFGNHRVLLFAVATILRDAQRYEEALVYARQLQRLFGEEYRPLVEALGTRAA